MNINGQNELILDFMFELGFLSYNKSQEVFDKLEQELRPRLYNMTLEELELEQGYLEHLNQVVYDVESFLAVAATCLQPFEHDPIRGTMYDTVKGIREKEEIILALTLTVYRMASSDSMFKIIGIDPKKKISEITKQETLSFLQKYRETVGPSSYF